MADFQLKTFSIQQKHTPMKVGMDGVLLGAYVSKALEQASNQAMQILDIGTGTGLISLMLAQTFPQARITAIEINPSAILDAEANIQNSPYASRIELLNDDFKFYNFTQKYDLIVSNPPFFSMDSLPSSQQTRALARHESEGGLTLNSLITKAASILADTSSSLFLISPTESLSPLRRHGCTALLRPQAIAKIYSKKDRAIRTISQWQTLDISSGYKPTEYKDLVLEGENGTYTPSYQELLAPFLNND